MDHSQSFASLQTAVQSALLSTTRTASSLAGEDLAFHRSVEPALGSALDRQNARLLGLAERFLGSASEGLETVRRPRLQDIEAVDGNWRIIVDAVDSLLERADTALDEFTGAVKRLSPGAEAGGKPSLGRVGRMVSALRSQPIEKPQLLFDHVPTNDEAGPFRPLLLSKPHATVPLETEAEDHPHPYQNEIEQYEYPNSIYTHSEPVSYHPFESTTAVLVDTEEAVYEMLEELKQAKEIAVDLEHHDQRSYIGIVSLMQISMRDKDWIVDTLKPWRRKLQCLNEVFADPKIIKVLHGAFMDVVWLQRDLGLYLVGLFDTHYACRALGYPGGSLAFLLKKFANVDAQKQYQTADWRVRPLPKELFDYARSDTHYLLYIFDRVRNELIEASDFSLPDHEGDKIWTVLQKSNEIALQRYQHPVYDPEHGQGANGWYKSLSRSNVLLSKVQFAVFRAVHHWRDRVAREQDDSVNFIMPQHQVFSIAKALPSNKNELFGIAQPITQAVKLRSEELMDVIRTAKDAGEDGPEMMDVLGQVEPQAPRFAGGGSDFSIAGHVAQLRNPAPIAHSSALPLRSTQSSFWGPAFENSSHQHRPMSTVASAVSLSVPLPPLTAEIFGGPSDTSIQPTPSKTFEPVSAAPTPEIPNRDDDVFVLKDSKKRKRAAGSHDNKDDLELLTRDKEGPETILSESAGLDEHATNTTSGTSATKKNRKARKADARGGKEAREAKSGQEEEPFDYASAPSLLNPPAETRAEMKERRKKEKNPYAKALDAPKGLPRVQKEKAGKSMTYRGKGS